MILNKGSYECTCKEGYSGFDATKLCILAMCPWNQWGSGKIS